MCSGGPEFIASGVLKGGSQVNLVVLQQFATGSVSLANSLPFKTSKGGVGGGR